MGNEVPVVPSALPASFVLVLAPSRNASLLQAVIGVLANPQHTHLHHSALIGRRYWDRPASCLSRHPELGASDSSTPGPFFMGKTSRKETDWYTAP